MVLSVRHFLQCWLQPALREGHCVFCALCREAELKVSVWFLTGGDFADMGQCLETRVLPASSGQRPGMLLNALQCTGHPQDRILWSIMWIVQPCLV